MYIGQGGQTTCMARRWQSDWNLAEEQSGLDGSTHNESHDEACCVDCHGHGQVLEDEADDEANDLRPAGETKGRAAGGSVLVRAREQDNEAHS